MPESRAIAIAASPARNATLRRRGTGLAGWARSIRRTAQIQPYAATSSGRITAGSRFQPNRRLTTVGGPAGTGPCARTEPAARMLQGPAMATETSADRPRRRDIVVIVAWSPDRGRAVHAVGSACRAYRGRSVMMGADPTPWSDAATWPAPISTWRHPPRGTGRRRSSSRTVDVDHPPQQALRVRDRRLDRRRRRARRPGGAGGPERDVLLEQLLPARGEVRPGPGDPEPLRHRLRDRGRHLPHRRGADHLDRRSLPAQARRR